MNATPLHPQDPARHPLYGTLAVAALAIAFGGFAPSFYLKVFGESPPLPALLHVHGVVMTLWLLLFLAQVRLAAAGRTNLHRRLGVAAACVAVLVVAVGVATALEGARRGVSPGLPPLVFLAIPLGVVVVFAAFVTAALLLRHRPDWHKRLMLLATLGLLTPAIARLPLIHAGGPLLFLALTDLLVLAAIAWDTARHRRLHPAFLYGFLFFLASQPLRIAIARTDAWLALATRITS